MPLIQVRNCPEDLYEKIAFYARQQNRTIAQQILVFLEKGLDQEQPNAQRRQKLLEKIQRRSLPEKVNEIDDLAVLDADRNR